MKNTIDDIQDSTDFRNNPEEPHHGKHHIFKALGIGVISLFLLLIIATVSFFAWLTPKKMALIADENIAKYIDADVYIDNIDYTFWSTFPHLQLEIDSMRLVSRTLDRLSHDQRQSLPENASFLASADKIKGSINVWEALKGNLCVDSLTVIHPDVNIVILNDSVNNFNIVPPESQPRHMHRFITGPIHIGYPANIKIFDVRSATDASILLKGADLKPTAGERDTYDLALSADVAGSTNGMALPQTLPVSLKGKTRIEFIPMALSLEHMAIDLADMKGMVDMRIEKGNPAAITHLSAEVATSDALSSIKHLPKELMSSVTKIIPILSSLKVTLPLRTTINLSSPYSLDGHTLPAFSMAVGIPGARLSVPLPFGSPLKVKNVDLNASFAFNPTDTSISSIDISRLSLLTDGLRLSMKGKMTDPLHKTCALTADVRCNADLATLENRILPGNSTQFSGKLNVNTHLNCKLSDLDVASLDALVASMQKMNINGNITADSLSVNDSMSGSATMLSGFDLKYAAGATGGTSGAKGDVTLKVDSLFHITDNTHITLGELNAMLTAGLREVPFTPSSWTASTCSPNDSIIEKRVKHTPLYATPSFPPILQTVLSMADMDAEISVGNGSMYFKGYPSHNTFSDLHLKTDLDTLSISASHLAADNTAGSVKGKIFNVRSFLSSSPALLGIDADINLKMVDINQLAGTYYNGIASLKGRQPDYKVKPLGKFTGTDSLCVAIPRNILADVRLTADSACYMQYGFSPLSADLTMHDGYARIGNLSITAPYTNAIIDWTYATSDLDDIHMDMDVKINDLDINKFCHTFPSVVHSLPQLADIYGVLDAEVEGNFLMYPSMFINAPSMTADFTLKGDKMFVRRIENEELKRLTHRMFIFGEDDIPVKGLEAHGSFHDNLLQLEPFDMVFGPHTLRIAGVNNLNGEIYYHVGVLRSPIHIPFGINIVGNHHHPSLRFGGAGVDDKRERHIAADLHDNVHVNIMREIEHGWIEFIAAAAKYDALNNHRYAIHVR